MGALPAQYHKSRIDRYPGKPGGEFGATIEILQMDERLHPCVLQGIFRIVAISEDPICRPECSVRMSSPQLFKGRVISRFGRLKEDGLGCRGAKTIQVYIGLRPAGLHRDLQHNVFLRCFEFAMSNYRFQRGDSSGVTDWAPYCVMLGTVVWARQLHLSVSRFGNTNQGEASDNAGRLPGPLAEDGESCDAMVLPGFPHYACADR